uniref:Orn/DAP/Arg decarboxylase 2 N-terminal domain-containing protein n=1 Tax=Globisporangium ultimum (strain ATCC 200006 / CBS 805.95 / DAOM BR144) TaxID=431595 RepID=K3X1A9_GLOUD
MAAALGDIDWAKYASQLDTSNVQHVVQQLLKDHALDGASSVDTAQLATLLLSALAKLSAADRYVAPLLAAHSMEELLTRHEQRSNAVTAVVQQLVAQNLLHDENPLVNLYDWDAYTARLDNLRTVLPEKEFNHAVAVKANPLRGILREGQARGFGAECASFAEAKHALSLGFQPRKVVYDSPCKTLGELKHLLLAGVYINLDNEAEVDKVRQVFEELGDAGYPSGNHNAQIGLRINPVVGGGTIDATSTATVTSKFGLPLTSETHDRLIQLFRDNPWLQGVHVHVGSQGCPIDLLVAGAKKAVQFALEINAKVGLDQIKVMDIGGGLPTVYDGGVDEAYDFRVYGDALRVQVPELFTSGFTSIITEFGRSIFVKPGITVSKVEAVKDWAGQHIAVVHVGADQFPRTAYLPELWSHCITVLGADGTVKPKASSTFIKQDIAGPLCFSGDFMAKQQLLPQIHVGDLVVIHDTGGYTMSMQSKYNSRQASSVYAYTKDKTTQSIKFALLKQRETAEEALAFWGIDHAVSF